MFSTLYFRRIVMLANFGFCYLYKRAGGRMELDDIVVTKLFDVMTIPIAKGTADHKPVLLRPDVLRDGRRQNPV